MKHHETSKEVVASGECPYDPGGLVSEFCSRSAASPDNLITRSDHGVQSLFVRLQVLNALEERGVNMQKQSSIILDDRPSISNEHRPFAIRESKEETIFLCSAGQDTSLSKEWSECS